MYIVTDNYKKYSSEIPALLVYMFCPFSFYYDMCICVSGTYEYSLCAIALIKISIGLAISLNSGKIIYILFLCNIILVDI